MVQNGLDNIELCLEWFEMSLDWFVMVCVRMSYTSNDFGFLEFILALDLDVKWCIMIFSLQSLVNAVL